jgi:hypothetical protein
MDEPMNQLVDIEMKRLVDTDRPDRPLAAMPEDQGDCDV